jgi:hypothetical protein
MNDPKAPIDRLMDQARTRGESRMILDNTRPEAVTEAQADAVIDAVHEYRTRTDTKIAAVARDIGCAASTLGTVLARKYPGNWQQFIIDLDRWLEAKEKRDAAPRATNFVWTRVAQEIQTVADAAVTLGTIGLVYGPGTSGTGKTECLKALLEEIPGSLLVTAEAECKPNTLLRAICRQLRISDSITQGVPLMKERIVRKLAGTGRLLMVDEAHNLCGCKRDLPLFTLTDILNATGAPQLWAGTEDIVAYLDRGEARGRAPLSQVRRRIGIMRDLLERTRDERDGGRGEPLYTAAEIRSVFAKNKIRLAPCAVKYLMDLANLPDSGALGEAANVVKIATQIHAPLGTAALTGEVLRSVHRSLKNSRTFSALQDRIDAQQSRPAAVRKVG